MTAGGVVAVAAAEWLYGAQDGWAWVAGVAAVAALLALVRPPRAPVVTLAAAAAAAAVGASLVAGVWSVGRIECCWDRLREARVTRASKDLENTLAAAVAEARRLADRGASAARAPRRVAFERVEAALAGGQWELERGVLVRDAGGHPWVWAGRHRSVPGRDTAELRAVITPFYVTLEARRQTPDGGTAIGTVLLDAAGAVPDREGALGAVFARHRGVELRFWAPGRAPPGADVFDYALPGAEPLFSVVPVPLTQGDAKLAALGDTARHTGVALAVLLACLLLAAPAGRARWFVLVVGVWAVTRGTLGATLDTPRFFSSATFYREALGPWGASAGSLAVLGALAAIAAAALWRRGLARRPWSFAAAGALVLAAPYLVRYFGRGIAPPAGGVSVALWLSWELALALAGMGLIMLAAALVRGRREPERTPWTLPFACAWAVLAALAGLLLWRPYGAWPEWYTFVWLPALAAVLVPAPRRWALAGTATVAGTAAALVTWGAAVEGRLSLAQRDAQRLGHEPDAVAVALLERLGARAADVPPPESAGELYALWLRSPLAGEAYPTTLGLWRADGSLIAGLRLAALDLPAALVSALAGSGSAEAGLRVERLERTPGVHYLLVAPLPSGDRLTVGVGPRSRLLPPDRVARFLRGEVVRDPPYTESLSPPSDEAQPPTRQVVWSRSGWTARGDRRIAAPGGTRRVYVRVGLGSPAGLLVRGALVVLLNLGVLLAVWGLAWVVTDGWQPGRPRLVARLRSSYRARLTAVLAAFVVLPILAMAVWSVARLRDEARRAGDLLIRQTLRDAAAAGSATLERPGSSAEAAVELGAQLDADLWVYRDGVLAGASAPVLTEMGLVDPFLAPRVYRRLALEDELDLTADGRTAGRPVRIGYRVMRAAAEGGTIVLAAPQLLDDERVREQQEDVGFALVLATLAGLAAVLSLAGLAARGLGRPVAALRDAAVAVGRGEPVPPLPRMVPQEFAPVFSAFERMAADVRAGRDALEEARRRTARVLANVATGVVALDETHSVTVANRRAEELLGVALPAGASAARVAPGAWAPVWNAVVAYQRRAAGGAGPIADHEFDIGGRQIRVQLAGLDGGGCVVALDDATELARAARVLAWGEMARQVAHEIKNPLTPIRLGIQHLLRAGPRSADFDATLRDTAQRILGEIDHLDAIARAFSRFGAPPAETSPLEPVDLYRTAQEVVQLYALGGSGERDGATFTVAGAGGATVQARQAEVKEVLVNLLENARQAGARRVVVRVDEAGRRVAVEDDGRGIPAEELGRVFEPTFSTTTSGSGLGLAIARRLVESWGGRIALDSRVGRGTTVIITFGPDPVSR